MAEIMIPVDEAQAGMVVAADILDSAGRTIIPKGARLTPMALKRLPKWGVRLVAVVVADAENGNGGGADSSLGGSENSGESSGDTDTVFIERITLEVEERFSCMEKTPFNEDYKRIITRKLIERGRGVIPGL